MDGFKNINYYTKAGKLGIIPNSSDIWGIRYDPGAYHDLHDQFPIIGDTSYKGQCIVVNKKLRIYESLPSLNSKVQRLCRGLILKYNLSNL